MNILHCICSLEVGGAEKLLVDTIENFKLHNEDKLYVCITNNLYNSTLVEKISCKSEVFRLERPEGSRSFKFIFQFIKLVKRLNIDIVHCHDEGSFKFSLISKIWNRNKVIYTIHDTKVYTAKKNFRVYIEKIIVDKYIAISSSVYKDIIDKGVNKDKIALIYNGIDLMKYKGLQKEKDELIRIGCVARLLPEKKGQDVLIKALSRIKGKYSNVVCNFAGDLPVKNGIKDLDKLNYLTNLCNVLGVDKEVRFLGNVEDVPNFLNSIDIFVLPSRYEGFGLALVEAMAAGKPVIASNIDGPKEILQDKYGYLFVCGDDTDLANKIMECIEGDNKKMIASAYNYISEKFSIEIMCKEYYKLYNTTLTGL